MTNDTLCTKCANCYANKCLKIAIGDPKMVPCKYEVSEYYTRTGHRTHRSNRKCYRVKVTYCRNFVPDKVRSK